MSGDFQKSATFQALVRCLIAYFQRQREEILAQTDTCGPIDTDEARGASIAFDRIDGALTELGFFDTLKEENENDDE